MKNPKLIFHYISYLQYPLMLMGLYYVYRPILFNADSIWVDYNKALLFIGLAVSFSTLQDTTKTQNKLSKRIWSNPTLSKIFLLYIALLILVVLTFGLYTLLLSRNENLQALSLGLIAFGIGLIGMLKGAVEMADNHKHTNN